MKIRFLKCYNSVTGAWMSLCVGAHGWVAVIASHWSVLLSRGWLITVEAPGHPRHPPSTQLDELIFYDIQVNSDRVFIKS